MRVDLVNGDYANVNFPNEAKVSIEGKGVYKVKWSRRRNTTEGYDFVGEMQLQGGRWGSHDYENVEEWKVDFYDQSEKLVSSFNNILKDKPVILVAKSYAKKVGKSMNSAAIKEYCTNVVNEFGCDLKVYFKETCKFDFTNLNFSPLRLNDDIPDMYFGIEKEF
jgi:hypothetical protein